jgi:hypothetical protein
MAGFGLGLGLARMKIKKGKSVHAVTKPCLDTIRKSMGTHMLLL